MREKISADVWVEDNLCVFVVLKVAFSVFLPSEFDLFGSKYAQLPHAIYVGVSPHRAFYFQNNEKFLANIPLSESFISIHTVVR